MSDQYDLYNGTPPHEDSRTSIAAAEAIRHAAPTMRHEVFGFIARQGTHGATDDEIEVGLGMRHQSASARRRELVLLSQLVDTGRTRKTRSGRRATVWILNTGPTQ